MTDKTCGLEASHYNAIVGFIWSIADDCLRDVYVRGKYRDVILPMTVIRRLDAILEDTKDKVLALKKKLDAAGVADAWPALAATAGQAFCNASPFRLKDLTSRAKAQTLKTDFEAYLDGFSPNVQEILEKFKFRNQIATMTDADILGSVISKFVSPDINLSPNPVWKDDAKTILKHPGLDNHAMGTIFEELIRRFNEENNEEAGEHWTPRDVVELMSDLVFTPVADAIKNSTYTCYDGACGTGGMLTVAQERLVRLAGERGKTVSIHLFGQEINPETYAIAKADLLLKGDGEQASHISYGSTLSLDANSSRTFDFMLSNPPYGKDWKTDAEKMGGKKEILDTRFNAKALDGEPLAMIPRTSDGQLLFLLNNVAKMAKDTPLGSRIAEVHNGSSIFTGSAGSGESNARRYLIENDLVEAIIAVPENMFYNTGIGTFIWILSNRKEPRRKGKIQLIDATGMKSALRKNMGKKNCEFTPEIRAEVLRLFMEMENGERSRVFDTDEFGYWEITVERPLRLRVKEDWKLPVGLFKKPAEANDAEQAVAAAVSAGAPLDDWTEFAKATDLKKTVLNKIRPWITVKDENAVPIEGEGDPDLRDTEIVPFKYEGGVSAFMANEVLTYAPDAWVDEKSTKIGYEINFNKYFLRLAKPRASSDIVSHLKAIDRHADAIMDALIKDLSRRRVKSNTDNECAHPEDWDVKRMRELFSFRKGLSITKADLEDTGVPVVSYGQIHSKQNTGTSMAEHLFRYVNPSYLETDKSSLVDKGDFIFADTSEDIPGCGNCAYADSDQTIFAGYHTIIAHLKKVSTNRYLAYYFQTPAWRRQIWRLVCAVKVYSITQRILKDTRILLPPKEKQEAIATYLDETCAAIDKAIENRKAAIEELSALKSRIIADAVTGRMEVE